MRCLHNMIVVARQSVAMATVYAVVI